MAADETFTSQLEAYGSGNILALPLLRGVQLETVVVDEGSGEAHWATIRIEVETLGEAATQTARDAADAHDSPVKAVVRDHWIEGRFEPREGRVSIKRLHEIGRAALAQD